VRGRARPRPRRRGGGGGSGLWPLSWAVYAVTIPTWLGGVGGAAIPTSRARRLDPAGFGRGIASGDFVRETVGQQHDLKHSVPIWEPAVETALARNSKLPLEVERPQTKAGIGDGGAHTPQPQQPQQSPTSTFGTHDSGPGERRHSAHRGSASASAGCCALRGAGGEGENGAKSSQMGVSQTGGCQHGLPSRASLPSI
jgi:hypothetical protein